MIDEDVLRRLLDETATRHRPPEGGPGAILVMAREPVARPTRPTMPVPHRHRGRWLLATAAAVAVFLVGVTAAVRDATEPAALGTAPAPPPDELQEGGESDEAGAGGAPVPSQEVPPLTESARVVKTGSLDIEVARGTFERTVERLSSLAVGAGGYVSETRTSESRESPSGSVTVRVPSAAFEATAAEVRRLGEVNTASLQGRDVTAEYTDIEARLAALTATRTQLLTVLGQASAVPDVLAVQDRIGFVQTEIERLQGQQRVLDDQTSFGTLAVTLAEPVTETSADSPRPRSGLAEAWDDAKAGFTGGIESIIAGSGAALVVLLCAAGALLAVRGSWILLRRRLV